ncbi:MAG TPA: c-type cytochrome, partial [bacterium]|nr:c-type cytochrome [bacterium]
MADFKDERAYDSQTLTKWFLWSSLALLVCVGLMAYLDYHREWKYYQRRFMTLQRIMARRQLGEVNASADVAQYKQLKSQLGEANQDLRAHEDEISKLQSKEASIDAQTYKVKNLGYQILKAQISADVYTYGEETKNGKNDPGLKKKIDDENNQADALNQKIFQMQQDRKDAEDQITALTAKRDEIKAQLAKLTADYTALKTKIQNLSFGPLFYFRNAMLLDFMAPTLQIQQVVLKNLPEDLYFAKTMRVDRCMTCHQAIDKKGFEDAPEPFRTHPKLDLFIGANSPHPMDKVGCTVCHGGMGPAVSFNGCAHVPNDEVEAKKWAHKYGWTNPELEGVQSIMVPLKYTEGSCLKCHGTQENVNFAPKLDRGRELMVTRGCVGCHKVNGLEHLTKAGPALYRVKGKLTKDFVLKWVWSPKSFNPAARMPSFFQQSNNSDPDSLAKNRAELNAVVDYIYDKSEDYTPNEVAPLGSVSAGKKLFKEVGCLACHGIDDVTSHHADFAPDLSGTGSKLSANFVYTWIKNPQHFNPDTRMPSLRLSGKEAADITAYLMSKRNKDFEAEQAPDFDPAVRDQLVVSYLTPQMGQGGANAELLKMDQHARQMYLGEKTLNKYGCFGCHMIKGFETAQGIGTELSTWGTKQIGQLDFGFTDPAEIPHTHAGFLSAKLSNPRQFDKDKVVAFADKLKMPNFYLSDEDREAVMTAVLGLTGTYIPDDMTAGIHGNGPLLEKGRRVIADFNCRGCHLIEDQGGRIREMYKAENIDLSLAPPNLHAEGSKVQIDWFHNFLLNVQPIRPWLHIRMPSFHWDDEKISNVITYFNLKDDQVYPFRTITTHRLEGEDLVQAQALFTKLQCQKCHVFGSKVPPDLNSAAP